MKTIANINNNTLAKSIADTNTNTFVTIAILFTVYYIQQHSFFPESSINNVTRMIVVEKWQNHCSLQWHDVNG